MLGIPFDSAPWFTQAMTLENVRYTLTFYWNSRDAYWYMDVENVDLSTLVMGIKMVSDLDLFAQYPGRGLPAGRLVLLDPSGNKADVAFADMTNGRMSLVYIESTEAI